MAAPYSQGGGGGIAGSVADNTNYAVDKPYDLTGDPTAEKMQQIDEMIQHLYRGLTLAVAAAVQQEAFSLLTAIIPITNANFTTIGTVDVPLIPAQGDRTVIVPERAVLHLETTVVWTSTPSLIINWSGGSVGAPLNPTTGAQINPQVLRAGFALYQPVAQTYQASSAMGGIINKALVLSAGLSPTGSGHTSGFCIVWYHVVKDVAKGGAG